MTRIVATLEAQIAAHREREAFHSEQEAVHRQRREDHAAEIEALSRKLEMFQAALREATDLASRGLPVAYAPPPPPDPDEGRKISLARMVMRVIEAKGTDESFGISAITAEVNQRYRTRFKKPVDPRQVSVVLRRMLREARLRSVREGRPFHEALYARV
ncbi:MAG TPA: hypothetical protein VLE27_10390 [Thermoanaerobaculia bacterium]|nr:hypothetical protein [Thermoanaerobaculia bacterium]